MRVFFVCFSLMFSVQLNAQIEVEAEKFPFNQIVEWKNNGSLLVSSDPKDKVRDVEVVLLDNSGELNWRKLIYPSHSKPSIIVSESSNYIYFIDHFKVENNKFSYIQINRSGSVVSTNFDLLKVVRSYGYTIPNELVVEEVVNTPKALVFHFTLEVKDKNIIENFFVTITHHNNRMYHSQGKNTHPDFVADGKEGLFNYAGSDEENIYFSRLIKQGGKHRVHFYPITPKAKQGNEYSFSLSTDFNPIYSEIINHNLCGSYYQKVLNKKVIERFGVGLYANNRFYYVANDETDKCVKIFGADQDGEIDVLNECNNPADKSRKYDAKIKWIDCRNRVLILSEIEGKTNVYSEFNSKIEHYKSENLNLNILQINPSRPSLENKSTNFVHLVGDKTYSFDLNQLGQSKKVVFNEQ
ncbi:MAG: hypothetical protein WED10_13410 [Brumimicrobium sp.]